MSREQAIWKKKKEVLLAYIGFGTFSPMQRKSTQEDMPFAKEIASLQFKITVF